MFRDVAGCSGMFHVPSFIDDQFTRVYLFQIAREKSFDYSLIIYKWQFLSRFSILREKWSVKLLQLTWKKIWELDIWIQAQEFIHSLQVMYENWAVSFNCKKQSLFTVELKLTTKQNKPFCGFDATFHTTVLRMVKNLWAMFKLIFARRNSSTEHKLL